MPQDVTPTDKMCCPISATPLSASNIQIGYIDWLSSLQFGIKDGIIGAGRNGD